MDSSHGQRKSSSNSYVSPVDEPEDVWKRRTPDLSSNNGSNAHCIWVSINVLISCLGMNAESKIQNDVNEFASETTSKWAMVWAQLINQPQQCGHKVPIYPYISLIYIKHTLIYAGIMTVSQKIESIWQAIVI